MIKEPLRSSEESEDRIRFALRAGQMGAWEWDVRAGTVYWSPELEVIHGLEPGTFEGTIEAYGRDIHPDDRDRVMEAIAKEFAEGSEEHHIEYRIARSDGEVRWVEGRGRILRDAVGSPVKVIGVCSDITARKEVEEELRTTEERYRLVLAGADAAIWDWDVVNKTVDYSPRWRELRGLSETEVSDCEEEWSRRIHPDDLARVMSRVQDHFEGRSVVFAEEYRVQHKDGHWVWIWDRGLAIRDEKGKVVRMAGSETDISERKAAELALARQAAQQAALYAFIDRLQRIEGAGQIYDAALDAIEAALACPRASILLFDETGVMKFVAWRGLSDGYREAVEGHSPWKPNEPSPQAFGISDVEHAALEGELKGVILGEGIQALAFIPLVLEGRLIGKFMVYFGEPHEFGQEELDLALTIGRQVALAIQRTRAQEDRSRAEQRLLESDRRKDEFLATLAHELRNPLAPIHSGLEFVMNPDAPTDQVRQTHGIIKRQAEHLARLVDDLLDVARISRGDLVIREEACDLAEALQRAIDMAAPSFSRADQKLSVSFGRSSLPVQGDPHRLSQVFGNLLMNAHKFTPDGGEATVSASVEQGEVVVEISDTGLGMSKDDLGRIFGLFEKATNCESGRTAGLGVGLALAREIVQRHGGTLAATSEGVGKGSRFTVRLPLRAENARDTAPNGHDDLHVPVGLRVLVIDDNVDAAETLKLLLTQEGHNVTAVHSGTSAIEAFQVQNPEVVLLDLGMPDMNGFEVAAKLRKLPGGRSTRLVALSGWGQVKDLENSRSAGFDDHLVKPAAIEEVRAVLARELGPSG